MTMVYSIPEDMTKARLMAEGGNPTAQVSASEVTMSAATQAQPPVVVQPQKTPAAQTLEAATNLVAQVNPTSAVTGIMDPRQINLAQMGFAGIIAAGCMFFVYTNWIDQRHREEKADRQNQQATMERMELNSNLREMVNATNQSMGKVETVLKSVDASVERLRVDQSRIQTELINATRKVGEEIRSKPPGGP